MALMADRVRETTTTAGTGTITLAGAATGYQSFSTAFGSGALVYYVIAGPVEWEIGIGTTGAGTLARTTVLQSTNADALVPFSAGPKDVFCAYVADRAVTTVDEAELTNKTLDSFSNFIGADHLHYKIKANAGITKGQTLKAVGYNAGELAIEVVPVSSAADIAVGISHDTLTTGQFGMAINTGLLTNVKTDYAGWALGDTLYPDPATGGLTKTKPTSGLYQACAYVMRVQSVNGVLLCEFSEPSTVEASTNTTNTVVLRDGSGNFAAGTITAAAQVVTGDLTVDTSTLKVDSANNRVGIGTATPAAPLDVNGTTTLRGAVSFLADATHDIGAVASARPRNVYTSGDAFVAGVRVGRGAGAVASNTVAGAGSLAANTTGLANTAIGNIALSTNETGNFSTAIGYSALNLNTAGDSTALGAFALAASTTGTQNTAVGRAALTNATTGSFNTAVGRSAMQNNTTGTENVAIGTSAMQSNVSATSCTAVGHNALSANSSATGSSTAIGAGALSSLNGGNACTAVGTAALNAASSGNDNTAMGRSAGIAVTTGGENTIIGRSAASTLTTGSRNTIIGRLASVSAAGAVDQIVIGEALTSKGDNTAFIGGTAGAYNEKNVTTWETVSDERLKRDIVDNHDGLDKINAIRVRNFTYRPASEVTELPASAAIDKPGVQLGVIAQEMLPECVSETSDGVKSVSTDAVLYYLINAVQQLHATVETLKQELGR